MSRFDVIVVGLGAAGSAAAAHLARRGHKVLGLDRFEIGNAHGSSHGWTRLFRLAYSEHPDYVPLLRRALHLWRDLEQSVERRLLFQTGGLYAGRSEGPLVAGALRAAREHGLAHEVLAHAEIRRRFPVFRLPEDHAGFLESDAGFVRCEAAIAAHAEVALRHGAVLRGHAPVRRWSAAPAQVEVETEEDTFIAQHLLFTAGPWTASLLPALGWPLKVTRQTLAWVWPPCPDSFCLGRFPCWAIEREEGGLHYGFPMTPGGEGVLGLKLALHAPGRPTDPDRVERRVDSADEVPIRSFLRSRLPDADGPLLSLKTCLYTSTPDGHFVIDRHPDHANVTVASPCSGHGFKFAPVIGEILADLVEQGRSRHPIEFLRSERWRSEPPG